MSLLGQTVLVTGGNSGVGLAIATAFAQEGASVYIACRQPARAEEARKHICSIVKDASVNFLPLVLDDLESVAECANQFLALDLPLHVLVNNAGMLASSICAKSKDGYERVFQVNCLGHYLLSLMLLPALERASPSSVINVASLVHKSGRIDFDTLEYWRLLLQQREAGLHQDVDLSKQFPIHAPSSPVPGLQSLYCNSKLANILFSNEFHSRFNHLGVNSYAICPGVVATDILKEFNWFVRLGGYIWMTGSVYLNLACTAETSAKTVLTIAKESRGKRSGTYWTYSKEVKPHDVALDPVSARRLWDLCADLAKCHSLIPNYEKAIVARSKVTPLPFEPSRAEKGSYLQQTLMMYVGASVMAFLIAFYCLF